MGGTLVGQDLWDENEQFLGNLQYIAGPTGGGMGPSQPWQTTYGLYLVKPGGGSTKFTPGTYITRGGGGKAYTFLLDDSGKALKSGSYNLGGTGGGGGGGTAGAQWRPGELEEITAGRLQRLDEIDAQGQLDLDAIQAKHDNRMLELDKEFENATDLQKVQIQADIDLEDLRHDNDMEELRERILADKKNLIFSEGMATGRTIIQEKGATGRALLGLGPDPSAQAAGMSGLATRGITPQAQAVGQARTFMNQPLPQMNWDMTPEQMQATLTGMQGMQAPTLSGPGIAGMAKGGTVKTKKPQSVIVGEAGKEIVTGSDFTVTPLTGTAQFGARIGGTGTSSFDPLAPIGPWDPPHGDPITGLPPIPPGRGINPPVNPPWIGGPIPPALRTGIPYGVGANDSILQNLAPMFAGSAFGQVPVAHDWGSVYGLGGLPGPGVMFDPFQSPTGMSPLDAFSELGIAPQLVRTPSGHTYFIQGGKRHYIFNGSKPETLIELGFNPAQVVIVTDEGLERYPPGSTFTSLGEQAAGAVTGQTGLGALGSPLIEPTSGAILRSPHKIAGIWQGLSPIQQSNILSAYKAAGGPFSATGFGIGPNDVLDMIQTFTPQGTNTRRIGGTGMWN